MEVYIGRQPILDSNRNVAAYELLFRSSEANVCRISDPVTATSQVIVNAVLGVGLDRLLGGKPAFVNFDRTLLLSDCATVLPPEKAVIEILETVQPDREVLSACEKLRGMGYALALDDCLDDDRTAAFAPFVDILKIDFQQTKPAEQQAIVLRYAKTKLRMIAEKVETDLEFHRARQLGCRYFQGFFFSKPTVMQAGRLPVNHMNCLRLVRQMQLDEPNFTVLEDLIRHDLAFSHSLLTYLNSAAFHWAKRVESIREGLLLMGTDQLRRWAWMASLSVLGQSRPAALMPQVLLRGRFCEAIASSAGLPMRDPDPFLAGMFSLLDAILQRPLAGILNDLNVGPHLRAALLGGEREQDPLVAILEIVKAWEVADWARVEAAARRVCRLSAESLNTCYLESLSWVDSVLSADRQSGKTSSLPASHPFHRPAEASAACVPAH